MSKGLPVLEPANSNCNGKKKQKTIKQVSISPEEIAMRKAASKQRMQENAQKSKQMAKLSPEELSQLKRQEDARKAAAYQDRWEASHNARSYFCRFASLACLVVSPQRLDPIIGAASCQQYALLVVTYHTRLRRALPTKMWSEIEDSCKGFMGAAAVADPRANLLPNANYEPSIIPEDMQALLSLCQTIFSTTQLRYLQLSLLLWESSVLSFDEFGQICRHRSNASLGRHESELRSEFSCLADTLYAEEVSALPDKRLLEVYQRTTSEYYMDKERVCPVKCPSVFSTFDINNHLMRNSDLIIAMGMTRVGMSKSAQHDFSYRLGFCDVFYYRKGQSTFDLIEKPTEEERSQACLFFDCVGTQVVDTSKDGISTLNKTEFRKALKRVDLAWLLMSWASAHPDHARRAEQITPIQDVHGEVYGDNVRELNHDASTLQKLDFSLPLSDQATPAEILHHGLAQATTNDQVAECCFNDISVDKSEAVPRTTSELYFHVVHVYASISKVEEQRLRAVEQRHLECSAPRLGRYIFTASRAGLSCMSRTQATTLQASTKRLQDYLADYPEQEVFCATPGLSCAASAERSGRPQLQVVGNGLLAGGAIVSVN